MPDKRVIVDHAPADHEVARMLAASLSVAGAEPALVARDRPLPPGGAAPLAVLYLLPEGSAGSAPGRIAEQRGQGVNVLLIRTGETERPASLSAVPQVDLRSWRDLGQYRQAVLQLLAALGLRPSGAPGPQAAWWVRNHDALIQERKRVTELFYLVDVALKNSHWFSRDMPFRWAEKAIDEDHLDRVSRLRDLARAETGADGRFKILDESSAQVLGAYHAFPYDPEARLRCLRTAAGQIIAVLDELEAEMLTAFLSTVGPHEPAGRLPLRRRPGPVR